MTTLLPVDEVSRPACLSGQSNGLLPDSLLWATPGLAGGPTVRLVAPAARSWRAMSAAAYAVGIVLRVTSSADSYRTLAQQVAVFTRRYTPDYLAGRPYRRWDSDGNGYAEPWYQLPGTAVAAVPGTSNHGLGLAVDVAGAGSADAPTPLLRWLLAHAAAFGWSWETQSEAWHIRYCAGDAIPAAVRAYEEGNDVGWTDLLPDPTHRQAQPGGAGDLLWMATWHAYDAKAAALQTQAAVTAGFAADKTRDDAALAAIRALADTGGVDSAPIVAAVTAVRDEARAEFARLHAELAAAQGEIERLRAVLAAAAQAEADKLAADLAG